MEVGSPDPLKIFNVWNFPRCDDRFGIDYPGRIPGQIIEHLLYYFTEPFDEERDETRSSHLGEEGPQLGGARATVGLR